MGGNWVVSSLSECLEQAKLGQVSKWLWILEIRSENGCGKPDITGHNPTKKFLGVPPSGVQEQGVNHVIIIIA